MTDGDFTGGALDDALVLILEESRSTFLAGLAVGGGRASDTFIDVAGLAGSLDVLGEVTLVSVGSLGAVVNTF